MMGVAYIDEVLEQEVAVSDVIIADVPGMGTIHNRVASVASEKGMEIADLAREGKMGYGTAQRIWTNDMTGIEWTTIIKVLIALNEPFEVVFPIVRDERYFNTFSYER